MADTHKDWLQQLEAQSKAKQEAFMTGIAKKLGRSRVMEPPAHPFRGAPDFWRSFQWPLEERIERFTEHFKAAGGNVERLNQLADVQAFVVKLAREMNARYIVRQQETELDSLGLEEALPEAKLSVWNSDPAENWKARAAEADIGIVMADYAAAYTGSITVLSAARKGRSVSLLPTVLIAVIPLERLKTRLGEILVEFDERGREQLPAGIHFISGPSRSADIENDLTIGVHGPGIVYALLVG